MLFQSFSPPELPVHRHSGWNFSLLVVAGIF